MFAEWKNPTSGPGIAVREDQTATNLERRMSELMRDGRLPWEDERNHEGIKLGAIGNRIYGTKFTIHYVLERRLVFPATVLTALLGNVFKNVFLASRPRMLAAVSY
jgi:hypothetical protein